MQAFKEAIKGKKEYDILLGKKLTHKTNCEVYLTQSMNLKKKPIMS